MTISPKSDVPSFEKKVKDTNDTTGDTSDWQDSADYDVNDKVPFQLKANLPSNYADYKTYYLAFHDVEEKGLSFSADSVKVAVDGTQITSGYEVKTTGLSDKCTFEVVFTDQDRRGCRQGWFRDHRQLHLHAHQAGRARQRGQREQGFRL